MTYDGALTVGDRPSSKISLDFESSSRPTVPGDTNVGLGPRWRFHRLAVHARRVAKHATGTGGIDPVGFPLVADVKHEITRAYGVEHADGVALRASLLIDREGAIQHQVINNLALGRNVDEMLRMVEGLQFIDSSGEVCPAGARVIAPFSRRWRG